MKYVVQSWLGLPFRKYFESFPMTHPDVEQHILIPPWVDNNIERTHHQVSIRYKQWHPTMQSQHLQLRTNINIYTSSRSNGYKVASWFGMCENISTSHNTWSFSVVCKQKHIHKSTSFCVFSHMPTSFFLELSQRMKAFTQEGKNHWDHPCLEPRIRNSQTSVRWYHHLRNTELWQLSQDQLDDFTSFRWWELYLHVPSAFFFATWRTRV